MDYDSMFRRLKERKLVQWALAYLAGAWLLLQVFGELRDNFGWSPLYGRMLTVLLAVGFLAALVLAWYHGERGQQRVGGVELLLLAGLLVLAGAAVASVGNGEEAELNPTATPVPEIPLPRAERNSVAVLPFANLSRDPENEYFSDGITDEILTTLANVGDLRVISRTSVMRYENTDRSLREIASELSVAHVLEGSVQRAGERVRINAQLISGRLVQETTGRLEKRRLGHPLRPENHADRARIRVLEGDRDGAIRELQEAVRKGWRHYNMYPNEPILGSLRGDPRFDRLMAEVKADVDCMRARVEREGW